MNYIIVGLIGQHIVYRPAGLHALCKYRLFRMTSMLKHFAHCGQCIVRRPAGRHAICKYRLFRMISMREHLLG